jgi:predicted RNA binding protein YcfA (HicA-like mRNA interferase family)
MNSSKLIRMLEDDGWQEVRVTGSHHHFKHAAKKVLSRSLTRKRTFRSAP